MTTAIIEDLIPDGPLLPSSPDDDDATLRGRLDRDGYLFVRGLIGSDRLVQVRHDILRLCRHHGWLADGTQDLDGIYAGRPFPDYMTEYMPLYRQLLGLDCFNACSTAPELVSFMSRLLGGDVLTHRRNIARISFPRHDDFVTQPHQDWFYIQGTPATYTTWIPAGDCPLELGALAILEGSHRLGLLPHEATIGAGNHGVRTDGAGLRWLGSDFRNGDVVCFHSHTVHAAMRNRTPDRLRLSLDFRYQRSDLPIDAASMLPHGS
jgi:ectoine hydroxylase-related dioxygenase (phytanoyl-CoA dioxygenase family)